MAAEAAGELNVGQWSVIGQLDGCEHLPFVRSDDRYRLVL